MQMKNADFLETSVERLRGLVGRKKWDYCAYWKLADDQSCLEWMFCCCGGAEKVENGESFFPLSPFRENHSSVGCRDVLVHHCRSKSCDALSDLPITISLDSGIHAQTFLSNQPKWVFSPVEDYTENSEMLATTRVLIPASGGLVEMFISKHVPEDTNMIQFVIAQINDCWSATYASSLQYQEEQNMNMLGASMNPSDPNFNFCCHDPSIQDQTIIVQDLDLAQGLGREMSINYVGDPNDNYHQQINNALSKDQQISSLVQPWVAESQLWDSSTDHQDMQPGSAFGFVAQQIPASFDHHIQTRSKPNMFYDESMENFSTTTTMLDCALQDKESIKHELGMRTDSMSDCSDQNEDEDDHKGVERGGRKNQSKNLVAERKRRKKLNDRLYMLRSIVPKITKMDRASILGDAIEYVRELQKQVKDLQDELEDIPADGGKDSSVPMGTVDGAGQQMNGGGSMLHQSAGDQFVDSVNGVRSMATQSTCRFQSTTKTTDHHYHLKTNNDTANSADDKGLQMEAQVEVSQIGAHEFCLKIFGENKVGGFSRLMQAIDSLGLDVVTVNIITFRCLVLNLFKVEMRENEAVHADQVRDSLLELTRNPNGWSE